MKTSSGTGKPKRSAAHTCLILNQFGTPGLGSIGAKHYVAGTIQLTIFLTGFAFFVVWFAQRVMETWRAFNDVPPKPDAYPWMGQLGWQLAVIAWLLAWYTTISVWRESKKKGNSVEPPPAVPPVIPPSVPPKIDGP